MNGTSPEDGLLRLDLVSKAYGATPALAPLSLTIDRGEAVAVVGPSGAGKTTLLHLLGGVIQPTDGEVALGGHLLADLSPGRELSRLVGVIHQQFDLVPQLSALHNVLAGHLGKWGLARSLVSLVSPMDRDTARQALERVGLKDKLHERAFRLSGGEQQRVAIARLLVQDPDVIIADEPVASLDPARSRDLMGLLSGIVEESDKTLIASVHSAELVRAFFSRAVGLRSGELVFDVPVEELTDDMLESVYELQGLEGEPVGQL
jgi:phosphonate transport system ATP-binding protein